MQNDMSKQQSFEKTNKVFTNMAGELRGKFFDFRQWHQVNVETVNHEIGNPTRITGIRVISDIITKTILEDIASVGLEARNMRTNDKGEVVVFCQIKGVD